VAMSLLFTGCASLTPSVKAVCSVCSTVCPLVGMVRPCPEGMEAVVTNWKAVEGGAEPRIECR